MTQCICVHEDTEGFKGFVSSEIVKSRLKFKFPRKNGQWLRIVVSYLEWLESETMKIVWLEQFGSSTFTEGVTKYNDLNVMHYFINLPVMSCCEPVFDVVVL
jgi:hypothetical protein